MDKKTIDRWNDFKPIVIQSKKIVKLPITTDKEMFGATPQWIVTDAKGKVLSKKPQPKQGSK